MEPIDKKKYLYPGAFAGLVFAGVMAAFDYNDDILFSISKFLMNFILFGGFMAAINYFSLRKARKNKK
ncbi:hypothetical protein ES677_06520 [Bizionia gelidisalsuginis]|uniref:Uncharacterized protein n=2 Tax=Bizionia TaxID=283785 RepID=A0A8H2QFQ1_9FLAO|nr:MULTISPECIES: hypothetical protein [Bizionia]TYB76614.1 hypothetical protein ES676_04530 [Bizionia saleffrena]TYC14193.1 hypothetical protein ES677_06520 [Bizionia gelidisalsuginis]